MNYSFSLTQKVNFYICAVFIFLFGLVLTTSIVHAINRDASDLSNLTDQSSLVQ